MAKSKISSKQKAQIAGGILTLMLLACCVAIGMGSGSFFYGVLPILVVGGFWALCWSIAALFEYFS